MSGGSDGTRRQKRLPEESALHNLPDYSPGESGKALEATRMEVFVEAMTPPGPAHLQELEQKALAEGVPIIRPQTQNLIRFFLAMKRPARILEIGTAVGFSALFMQYYAPADCRRRRFPAPESAARGINAKKHGSNWGSGNRLNTDARRWDQWRRVDGCPKAKQEGSLNRFSAA